MHCVHRLREHVTDIRQEIAGESSVDLFNESVKGFTACQSRSGQLNMGKRVFIAMPVEEVFRHNASSFRDAHSHLPVRWVSIQNLHVTLMPPWYCDNVEEVCVKLQKLLAGAGVFTLCFNEISVGPTSREPRLIWASGGVNEALRELQEKLSCLAGPLPDKSGRAFLLHVTLARTRKGQIVSMAPQEIDWKVTPGSVCLYESTLRPSGAEYRELCRVGLG